MYICILKKTKAVLLPASAVDLCGRLGQLPRTVGELRRWGGAQSVGERLPA